MNIIHRLDDRTKNDMSKVLSLGGALVITACAGVLITWAYKYFELYKNPLGPAIPIIDIVSVYLGSAVVLRCITMPTKAREDLEQKIEALKKYCYIN